MTQVAVVREHSNAIRTGMDLTGRLMRELDFATSKNDEIIDTIEATEPGEKRRLAARRAVGLPARAAVMRDLAQSARLWIQLERQAFRISDDRDRNTVSAIEEMTGLIDLAAENYRVIAFDRPGFGHSTRPRHITWTPEAQASLIAAALEKIGVPSAIILGHSWGTLVALALAMDYPRQVQSLVLASGYYYPTARADVVILSPPATPIIGDFLSLTISPLLSRVMWPLLLRKIFGPSPVPKKFDGFPEEMAVRPSQIRASAAETAMMIPAVRRLQSEYGQLQMPVAIVAGREDQLIDCEQSARLNADIPDSKFRCVPNTGHMVHQTETTEIISAIDSVAHQKKRSALVPSAA